MLAESMERTEEQFGGAPDTSYAGVIQDSLKYAQEDRVWKEKKNLQRQKMMSLATEGWDRSTNIDSLSKQGDWLTKYLTKNRGNMDDITLEYGDLLQSQINNRSQRIVKLHTDESMLNQSKEQWLGIADDLVGRELGHEDYSDLSVAIDQYVKFKGDMLTSNADFLALPQFQHIKQDMIGQDLIIKEIMTEAKDANIFSPYEHEWTTRALEEGNYALIQEERLKRAQDRERDVGDLGGVIDKKMDLYRRVQEIAGGGSALLPEITRDTTSLYSLQDLGFDKTEAGDYVPSEVSRWRGGGDEEELLRSQWSELAGSISPTMSGDRMGSAEIDLKEVDALYETKFGNKYTFGKYGFEDLYADPNKPAKPPGGDPDVDVSEEIVDDDGFVNIDKAIDSGFTIPKAVVTTGVGISAVAYNYPKIKKVGNSALQFMGEVGFLSEDEIARMFVDKDAKNIMNSIDNQMIKIKRIDKDANPAAYREALKELQAIQTSGKNKLLPKYSEKLVKSQKSAAGDLKRAQLLLEDIKKGKLLTTDPEYVTQKEAQAMVESARKEFDKITGKLNNRSKGMTDLLKNPTKWNLWKMKTGLGLRQAGRTVKDLAKIGGKTFGKLTPLDAAMWGWYIGDEAGLDNFWKTIAAGTSAYSAKQVMNLVSRKGGVMKAMMNPTLQSKIGKYLVAKAPWLAIKMGIKAGAGGVAQTVPFFGQLFGGAMLAWTAKDLYNLISDVPELTQYIMEWGRGEYDEDLAKPQVLPKF